MFWHDLTAADQAAVAAIGVERTFTTGSYVFFEGDPASHVLVVLAGMMKLTTTAPDGRTVLIELRREGELVGELAAIDGRPRSLSAIVIARMEALVISAERFRELLMTNGNVAMAVMTMMADRIRETNERRLESGTAAATARLAGRLVELAQGQQRQENGEILLKSVLTQQELAEWIGASRDAVVLGLRELRTKGFIKTGRQRIRILDLDALIRYSSR